MFDTQLLPLLLFVFISIGIIFAAKTRISTIALLIAAHLSLILFFSLAIANYSHLKEAVLTLIAYLMLVLFLIANYGAEKENRDRPLQIKSRSYIKIFAGFAFFMIFSCALYLVNNVFYSMKNSRNNREVHVGLEPERPTIDAAQRKKNRLKKELSENFLFKHSSGVILTIVFATSISLLLQHKKNI